MQESEGWQQELLPYLKEVLNQSFPDPTKITGIAREEQWTYECKVASIFKKTIIELIGWVDMQVNTAVQLELKQQGKIKDNFGIGRESE